MQHGPPGVTPAKADFWEVFEILGFPLTARGNDDLRRSCSVVAPRATALRGNDQRRQPVGLWTCESVRKNTKKEGSMRRSRWNS
jgi:hypothetical protein